MVHTVCPGIIFCEFQYVYVDLIFFFAGGSYLCVREDEDHKRDEWKRGDFSMIQHAVCGCLCMWLETCSPWASVTLLSSSDPSDSEAK